MSTRLAQAESLLKQKEYPQALAQAQKLVRTGQHLAQAHNIVGIAALELGKHTLAQSAFEKVIHLQPHDPAGYVNLTQLAFYARNWPLMLSAATKAAALKPHDPEAACQIASAHISLGNFQEALTIVEKVRTAHPGHPKAEAFAFSIKTDLWPLEKWAPLWEGLPVNQWPLPVACNIARLQVVWSWAFAQNDFPTYLQQLRNIVAKAQATTHAEHPNVVNAEGYAIMFENLATHGLPPALNPNLPRIYMLGDSHALPPQHQTVTWQGQKHQLHPRIITGLKLWDFANPQFSPARKAFLHQLNELPANATVIITVGEIDARPIFGIYKYAQKHHKPWAPLIQATVPPAIAWLKSIQGNRSFILTGIPAPTSTFKQQQAGSDNVADYIACATAINAALREEALGHAFPFIDIFTYTTENPTSFAEAFHLVPTALPKALQTHLVLPA